MRLSDDRRSTAEAVGNLAVDVFDALTDQGDLILARRIDALKVRRDLFQPARIKHRAASLRGNRQGCAVPCLSHDRPT